MATYHTAHTFTPGTCLVWNKVTRRNESRLNPHLCAVCGRPPVHILHPAQTVDSHRNVNGFDYDRQAWVTNGRYIPCGHPIDMNCRCYGRLHAGELAPIDATIR